MEPEAVYEMNPNTYKKTITIMSGQMTTMSNFSSLLKGLSSPSLVISFSYLMNFQPFQMKKASNTTPKDSRMYAVKQSIQSYRP